MRGTLYAFAGTSLFVIACWKAVGAKDVRISSTINNTFIMQHLYRAVYLQFTEFRVRVGNWLPRIPKSDPPQGRTEFSGFRDLFEYLISEDEARKKAKQSAET